jgi:hypothetical protein
LTPTMSPVIMVIDPYSDKLWPPCKCILTLSFIEIALAVTKRALLTDDDDIDRRHVSAIPHQSQRWAKNANEISHWFYILFIGTMLVHAGLCIASSMHWLQTAQSVSACCRWQV